MSRCNYASFRLDADMQDFVRFPDVARAGTKAPGGELVDAKDGSTVRLAELYRGVVTVVEVGSRTSMRVARASSRQFERLRIEVSSQLLPPVSMSTPTPGSR